ncbi:MAG: DUF3108 domain-containing protein [Bryobacterales bacterium]|nr:DUF3108 domain-containing protein [Bryobacterales bacterium]
MLTPAINRWALRAAFFALTLPVSPQAIVDPPKPIETLQYGIEWRLVRAGMARLSRTPQANSSWAGDLHLESAGLVSKLYKVNDDYRVLFDSGYCVSNIHLASQEGSRRRDTKVTFNRQTKKSHYLERDLIKNNTVLEKELDTADCVQDIVAALARLRATKLAPGQSATFPMSDGKKMVQGKIDAQEKELVKTPSGEYQTIRYEAHLFNDVLFRRKAKLYVWLTEDDRKLPVQIRVRLGFPVGTITLQLEKVGPS